MTTERIKEKKRKNRATIAKFIALRFENEERKKCMITFTGKEETYIEVAAIRKAFIEKIRSLLQSKYKGNHFQYFAAVEFGKDPSKNFNPHLHIQCYFDDVNLIYEAYEFVIGKMELSASKCELTMQVKSDVKFFYIVKNFMPKNFDIELESFKDSVYKGKAMTWSSRKSIPNYFIKRLYQYLSKLPIWKTNKDKYQLISKLLTEGSLLIRRVKENVSKGFKRVKNWCFKVLHKTTLPKTPPYKINISYVREKTPINSFLVQLLFIIILSFHSRYRKIEKSFLLPLNQPLNEPSNHHPNLSSRRRENFF